MSLRHKRVLVTGATGFIGGRLAERLAGEEQAKVTGTGRNLEAVSHLRDCGVNLQYANLLDLSTMRELAAENEVVFHVAAWLGSRHGDDEMAWPLNVFATLNLVRGAAEAGVKRLVYVSSIMAYGPPTQERMAETVPVDPMQHSRYGRTKAEAEQKALHLASELGLALVVVRPGMVYGPRSRGWSERMLRLVQNRVPVLYGRADGYAYPINIDNLVDGMLQAAVRSEGAGEAFNFVDDPLTWEEWFGYYGEMCGRRPVRIPLPLARFAFGAAKSLPLGLSLDRSLLRFYTGREFFPTEKAQRLLGYRPRVGIAEGMRHTETWLRSAGFLAG